MDRADELEALAERVEALTGPDREVSDLALRAFGWRAERAFIFRPDGLQHFGIIPDPTASLDAAMSLVPEHANTNINIGPSGVHAVKIITPAGEGIGIANTPALALAAAALRALAAVERGK